ncbi:MAG TPA: DUF1810 domain-containing protein [Allosphingosinicella sp.]|jgi:uncharacterized protein (DUF1810 family)
MTTAEGLQRFTDAQAQVYETALRELRLGRKRGHWMWYIFPQLRGLGMSSTSQYYGIESKREAEDYLGHGLLGPRLIECVETVNALESRSAESIFGATDSMKLRSCATLFEIAGGGLPFRACLDRYFGGRPDDRTTALLSGQA